MNLVLDRGNTNVKLALFHNDKMIDHYIFSDFSLNLLNDIYIKYPNIKYLCLSNTGNSINQIHKFCQAENIKYLELNHKCSLPICINYTTPSTLGSDRIALCIGAHINYPGNKLIIDLGTCLTYDIMLKNKYLGGQISPGINMRLQSLHGGTANLPKLTFAEVSNDVGQTTSQSMLVGIYDSILFEIEGVIQKYKSRYPNVQVILTGGDSNILKEKIKNINFINPYLLMEGLNYIIASNE